jgi:hypothetical protein
MQLRTGLFDHGEASSPGLPNEPNRKKEEILCGADRGRNSPTGKGEQALSNGGVVAGNFCVQVAPSQSQRTRI